VRHPLWPEFNREHFFVSDSLTKKPFVGSMTALWARSAKRRPLRPATQCQNNYLGNEIDLRRYDMGKRRS